MTQILEERGLPDTLGQLLPKTVLTKSGINFSTESDLWSYKDGTFKVHIDFTRIPLGFTDHNEALKHTLTVFAPSAAPTTLQNLFEAYLYFVRSIDPPSDPNGEYYGLSQVWQFIEKIGDKDAWRIGALNGLLQKWHALGLPGVTDECVAFLRARRKPGNEKGRAVRTHDPEQGPFTEHEYVALYSAVDTAFGKNTISRQCHSLTRLLFATGQRIAQYASMKLCDVRVETSIDGIKSYSVQIPQVKKRLAHARMAFETYDLSPQTGELLFEYVRERKAVPDTDDQCPLFILSEEDVGQGVFKGHCTAKRLQIYLCTELERIAPPTSRLEGAPIPISPRRFRYTLGTRMAQERYSLRLIAKALGHADLQSASVYIEATPKIIENINKTMGKYLSPIAHAFVGTVIEGDADSSKNGAPGSRIYDFKVAKAPIGSCAGPGGCGFAKPVACYVCASFEPWLDAPHEKLLSQLLDERERVLQSSGERMAAINDQVVIAIMEVMTQCAQVKAQRNQAMEE